MLLDIPECIRGFEMIDRGRPMVPGHEWKGVLRNENRIRPLRRMAELLGHEPRQGESGLVCAPVLPASAGTRRELSTDDSIESDLRADDGQPQAEVPFADGLPLG